MSSVYWSKLLKTLTPYRAGAQPEDKDAVKLNTNENPFPPSEEVLEAIRHAVTDQLRLYPSVESDAVREAIAAYHQLTPESVFIGNGSDEILAFTFAALLNQDKPVFFPDITYSFYRSYCALFSVACREIPLTKDFEIDLSDYETDECGAVIFPNPNAPTGVLLPAEALEAFITRNRHKVIVIDEAYIDFGGQSVANLIKDFDNLLVVRTLSKSRSLAGMRIGYALGNPALIEALTIVKNSFNSYPIDRMAQTAAIASFTDDAGFVQNCTQVISERARLSVAMTKIGFTVLPSAASFILATHPHFEAVALLNALQSHNIWVRHFNSPRIEQYLRISIGTETQNNQLIDALHKICQ